MQFKKLTQVVLIGLSMVAISACTHNKKGTDPNAGSSYEDPYSNNAQTSGLGENSKYGNEGSAQSATAKNTYYFDFDSSLVREQDKPAIYAKADYLIAHPSMKVMIEGHTDPRGSREYNVGLGERRANAVAEVLKSKGVSPSQIRVVSYGAERLAATGHSEQDYQLDRRAVYVRLQG